MPPRATVVSRSTAAVNGESSSLAASTRARQDPLRRIGNGNAVARGVDLTRVGVLSDRELSFFHRLATASSQSAAQQQLDARAQEEARRRELSKARTANWPDTIEARHDRFLQAQQDAKDAAEERQRVLDELYAEKLKEERQAVIAQQELAQLKEDPRGRNAQSMKLLHETLKEREAQVAYREQCREDEKAAVLERQRELQLQAWGDQAEALHKKLETRQRNMAEKNANLEIVLYQIDQRRQERAAERQERVRVDQEAAEERAEQAEEDAVRQARERENGDFNVAHSRTARTKAQKLHQRVEESVRDDAVLRSEEQRHDQLKASVKEREQKKQGVIEKRKEIGMQRYRDEAAPELAPTYRTQDVFMTKGQSFLQRMHDGNARRQDEDRQYRTELRQQREREEAGVAEDAGQRNGASSTTQRHHTATVMAGGFFSEEEERAYVEQMRRLPEELKAEQAQAAAARRAEAQRIEEIQKLQAAEKRENARRAVESRRDEMRQQQERRAQDDARYSAFIDSTVPADMDPVLYRKAKQLQ